MSREDLARAAGLGCAENPLAGFRSPADPAERAAPHELAREVREPLEAEPLVRVGRRRAATRASKRLPAPVYGALVAGSERGQTIADNDAAFGEIGLRAARRRPAGRAAMATTRDGPGHLAAGDDLPDRRPGGAPRRRGRGGPRRRGPGHGDGAVATSPASRSRRSSRPTRARSSRCTGPATAT